MRQLPRSVPQAAPGPRSPDHSLRLLMTGGGGGGLDETRWRVKVEREEGSETKRRGRMTPVTRCWSGFHKLVLAEIGSNAG